MKTIISKALAKGMSYSQYRDLINRLMAVQKTTGNDQSEAFLHYTRLNIARMDKWDKRYEPTADALNLMRQVDEKQIWLVISEAWCGDAAHSVPVIAKLAAASEAVEFKLVLRDEEEELMDLFLTNGARSIPKLIRLNADTLEVLDTWGSSPAELNELKQSLKRAEVSKEEFNKAVQIWYARNRGQAIESEIISSVVAGEMV